jgi:hypothetical protein
LVSDILPGDKSIITNSMTGKNQKIIDVVDHLQTKYGAGNILVNDHWESDENAIGLVDKSRSYLAYISTIGEKEDNYYLSLENPPVDNDFPYSPSGDFHNLGLTELENLLSKHLRLQV